MEINILTTIEWVGSISALLGTVIISTEKFKNLIHLAWILWIFNNFCYMFLFYKTNQLGLLYGSIGGLIINLLGLYQWTQKEIKLNKNIRKTMLLIVYLFFGVSIYNIFLFINEPNLKIAEWIGSIFGLCGALLLAARFKYSFLCWFAWIISNGILIITTLQTKQYGVFSLQLGFMVLNIYGVIYWFKNYKKLI